MKDPLVNSHDPSLSIWIKHTPILFLCHKKVRDQACSGPCNSSIGTNIAPVGVAMKDLHVLLVCIRTWKHKKLHWEAKLNSCTPVTGFKTCPLSVKIATLPTFNRKKILLYTHTKLASLFSQVRKASLVSLEASRKRLLNLNWYKKFYLKRERGRGQSWKLLMGSIHHRSQNLFPRDFPPTNPSRWEFVEHL